jgi:hypothetical protein
MGEVSRHELYSKAAKHPQLRPKQPSELLFDHEFCRLFKALEGTSEVGYKIIFILCIILY